MSVKILSDEREREKAVIPTMHSGFTPVFIFISTDFNQSFPPQPSVNTLHVMVKLRLKTSKDQIPTPAL